jgi:hypothetical protein
MLLNIALSEAHNLIMVFFEDPDVKPEGDIILIKIEIPPDNVKELVDKYITSGYNVIVTPLVVKKCGLKETDFSHIKVNGEAVVKNGSVEEIAETLVELERRRLENEQ